MQKITTFLTYNNRAGEAMNFYISIFKDSKILGVSYSPASAPGETGSFMVGSFELSGQAFVVLNGGPGFNFSQGISLQVNCETQEEIDELWEKLCEGGGQPVACGWLTDKFGVSWQITPPILGEMLQDKDPVKANRVMAAMMQMIKIDINLLKQAYNNG